MLTKSWKNQPQKLLRKTLIHFFSLLPWLPKRPKQKNSCSKMWPIHQLYIELGIFYVIKAIWQKFVGYIVHDIWDGLITIQSKSHHGQCYHLQTSQNCPWMTAAALFWHCLWPVHCHYNIWSFFQHQFKVWFEQLLGLCRMIQGAIISVSHHLGFG